MSAPALAPASAPAPAPGPEPAPEPLVDPPVAPEAAPTLASPLPPAADVPVAGSPRGRLVAVIVAAAVVAAALVTVWTLAERAAVRDRQAVLATLQTQLAAIPSPTAPTRRLLVLGADRRARVDAIAGALGGRVAWDRVMREVSAVLPADTWLTALSATAVTQLPAGGEPVRLEGYAKSQQAVALALSRLALLPDLTDVRLVRSARATVSGTQVVRFAIVAGVRRDGA
jgi:Tfp pilus assembly protein PilN